MNRLILVILLTFHSLTLLAASVGSKFSYQGQLQLNNVPVSGLYDFKVELWNQETAGNFFGTAIEISDVNVNQGIFTFELDFTDIPFSGDDWYLKIQVREGTSTGSYTAMSPRQRINVMPYAIQADYLAANGASNGQVLKFDGTDWIAGTDNTGVSPWGSNFGGVQYIGDVVIGNLAASAGDTMQIVSEVNESPLRVQVGGAGTRFRVSKNGGTGIGANYNDSQIPENGLKVEGDIQLVGDAKQDIGSHGFAKAGIEFSCGSSGTTRINYFNNINEQEITVTNGVTFGACKVELPFSYVDLFYQTTVEFNGSTPLAGSCNKGTVGGNTEVTVCRVYNIATGTNIVVASKITLLIY